MFALIAMPSRKWTMLRIVALVLATFPFVWFAIVFVLMQIAGSRNWSEIEVAESRLPKVVQSIRTDFPGKQIVYHQLKNGFDLSMTKRGIVRIDGTDCVQRFIETGKLQATNQSHPKREEFEKSLLLIDSSVRMDGNVWFASPGFGTIHQEIVDLYLLQTTDDRHAAVVYHYWTF
jgi:hypothetical protein